MINLKISEDVQIYEEKSVEGIEFEFDVFDGDEYVSVTIGNQMINVKKEQLKRAVASI